MSFVQKLRSAGLRRLVRYCQPAHIDTLMYEVQLDAYQTQIPAKIELSIEKTTLPTLVVYKALSENNEVHRSHLYHDVLVSSQFGYGKFPAIGDCVTHPEYRGLGIYPHVLSYILRDLQADGQTQRVYIFVAPDNTPSIRGIEHAGFKFVARLKGTRIAGLIFNRSVDTSPRRTN